MDRIRSTARRLLGAVRQMLSTSERGSSSVEAIILIPALFLIVFSIVQGAIWLHAGNIAQAAASSGYNEARLYEASDSDGVAAATAVAQQSGTTLSGVGVSIDRSATEITATVTGNAISIVPGMPIAVSRTVSGPIERWIE